MRQRLPGLCRLVVEHVVGDCGLHMDEGELVAQDVVEVAGDPQPFLGDRPPGQFLPGPLQLGRPLLGGDDRLLAPPGTGPASRVPP